MGKDKVKYLVSKTILAILAIMVVWPVIGNYLPLPDIPFYLPTLKITDEPAMNSFYTGIISLSLLFSSAIFYYWQKVNYLNSNHIKKLSEQPKKIHEIPASSSLSVPKDKFLGINNKQFIASWIEYPKGKRYQINSIITIYNEESYENSLAVRVVQDDGHSIEIEGIKR